MKRFSFLIWSGLFLTLSACSIFTSQKDNLPPPAALSQFKAHKHAKLLWHVQRSNSAKTENLKLQPTLVGGIIYTADNAGQITATRARDAKLLWRANVKAPITSGPTVASGLLVVGTANAEVLAFEQLNGSLLWKASVENEVLAAPTIVADKVIVKAIDGDIQALARNNGQQLWRYRHPAPNLILRSSSSPRIVDGKVITGFADGRVMAISLETGDVIWQQQVTLPLGATEVDRMVDIDADPIIDDNKVFIATYQGSLVALDLQDGAILWKHKLSTYSDLSYQNHLLFAVDAGSHVWAFRASDGGVEWHQDRLHNRSLTAPVIMGHLVVVGDKEGYLHYLSQTDGHFIARHYFNRSGILAAPVVHGRNVYVLSKDGELAAYHLG